MPELKRARTYLDTARLAALVKTRRGKMGLREVSEQIGTVSPSTLSRVENGKVPDLELLFALADWLGIPVSTLFVTEGEPPTETIPLDRLADAVQSVLFVCPDFDPVSASAIVCLVEQLAKLRSPSPANVATQTTTENKQ